MVFRTSDSFWLQTPVTRTNSADDGVWGTHIQFPLVPAAASLLHTTGSLLTWSSYSADTFGSVSCRGH